MGENSDIPTGKPAATLAGRRPILHALAVLLVVAITGCSSSNEAVPNGDLQATQTGQAAGQVSQPAGAVAERADENDGRSSSGEPTSTSLALIASPNAESLQDRSGELAQDSLPASQFLAESDGSRLDQLGDSICSALSAEPTTANYTSTISRTYSDALNEQEQESLGRDGWSVVFGAIARTYCPDQVPTTPPGSGTLMDKYRIIVDPSETFLPQETLDFIQASSNERLEELKDSACSEVNPEMDLQSLAAAIDASYDELTESEQAQLTPSGYGELYLDLVGFFCFENVPQ